MKTFDNCPSHNGIKNGCPYFHEKFGKCFSHCDLKSDLKCGDCAHWLGNCTIDDKPRHKLFGSCFYCVSGVCSTFKTNCKHYTERKQNEPNYVDWVEARVLELGGKHDSSPESRELRKQARQEWADVHN